MARIEIRKQTIVKKLRQTQRRLRLALCLLFCGAVLFLAPPTMPAHGQGGGSLPPGRSSLYYDFSIMRLPDDFVQEIYRGVSVNSQGTVAFGVRNFDLGSGMETDAVLVGDNPANMNYAVDLDPKASLSPWLQLNDKNQLVTHETTRNNSGTLTRVRVWDATQYNSGEVVAAGQATNPTMPYDGVFNRVGINNAGEAVFTAIRTPRQGESGAVCNTGCLVTRNSELELNEVAMDPGVEPVIATGNVLVREEVPSPHLRLLNMYLEDAGYDIGAESNFTEIGEEPGISDDGVGVAFWGVQNGHEGIWLATNYDEYASVIPVAVVGAPVLGWNNSDEENIKPVSFVALEPNSPINVVHQNFFSDQGLIGDSFTVLFMGTPDRASITNSVTGQPLIFSDQLGLWTVRIDVLRHPDSEVELFFQTTSPRPVVQLGDRIVERRGEEIVTHTITDFNIHHSLAMIGDDDILSVRGSHYVAFWAETAAGKEIVVRARHADFDEDGLLNHWEDRGLDMDADGKIDLDLPALGADRLTPDIFLEIDWLKDNGAKSYAPRRGLRELAAIFAAAPEEPITLHIDAGPYSVNLPVNRPDLRQGGDLICAWDCAPPGNGPHLDYVFFGESNTITPPAGQYARPFHKIKDAFFGTNDKRAREFVFHYAVIADQLPDRGGPTVPASRGEMGAHDTERIFPYPGNDLLITTNGGYFEMPNLPRGFFITQSLAHELGHNLGLKHGGDVNETSFPPLYKNDFDAATYRPRYQSLMNYAYTYGLSDTLVNLFNGEPQADLRSTLVSRAEPFIGYDGLANLANLPVRIFHGPAASARSYTIHDNTKDTLTIEGDWSTETAEGAFAVLQQTFAGADDPVFNDWEAMQFDFQNYFGLFGSSYGGAPSATVQASAFDSDGEVDFTHELLAEHLGPFDYTPPTIEITSPVTDTMVGQGGSIDVSLTVTDDLSVEIVTVDFDQNGDGTLESSTASTTTNTTYIATLGGVSGPTGTRTLRITASDGVSRTTVVSRTVRVTSEQQPTTPTATATATATDTPSTGPTATATATRPSDPGNGITNGLYLPLIFGGGNDQPRETPATSTPDPGTPTPTIMPTPTASVSPTPTPTASPPIGIEPTPLPVPSETPTPIGSGVSTAATAHFGLGAIHAVAYTADGSLAAHGGVRGAALVDVETSTLVQQFGGHTDRVNAVAFSPDSSHLFTGSQDGTVRMWETTSGRLVRTFARSNRREYVTSLAISPDGNRLLVSVHPGSRTGQEDDVAILWEIVEGKILYLFDGHTSGIQDVAYSPDGSHIATASADNTLQLWDAITGSSLRSFRGHTGAVNAVVFTPDGGSLISGSLDGQARIWNVQTGAFQTLDDHINSVQDVAISADGTRLLTASLDQSARLWDVTSGTLIQVLENPGVRLEAAAFAPDRLHVLIGDDQGQVRTWDVSDLTTRRWEHGGEVNAVAIAPDGTQIVTGGADNAAHLWDQTGMTHIRSFTGHTQPVLAAVFAPDGTRLLTGSQDQTARLWEVSTGALLQTFAGHTGRINSIAFSPDSSQVLTGGGDNTARLWDATTGAVLRTFEGHTYQVNGVAFSPDGAQIATASDDGTVRIWETATGAVVRTDEGHGNLVQTVAFAPDGEYLFSLGGDKAVRRWHKESGATQRYLLGSSDGKSMAVSTDGTRLAVGLTDGTVQLWDVVTGQRWRQYRDREATRIAPMNTVAFTPDGAMLVAGDQDGRIHAWSSRAGTPLNVMSTGGHHDGIETVAISPDGTRILTGSMDDTLILWDATTQQPLQVLRGHQRTVYTAAFSHDGTRIVSGDGYGQIFVWDAASGSVLRTLRLPSTNDNALDALFTPDGTRIVVGSSNHNVYIWSVENGELLHTLTEHNAAVNGVAITADGNRILTGSDDSVAILWDTNTGAVLGSLGRHEDAVTDVAFAATGNRALTTSLDGAAYLWDLTTNTTVQRFGITIPTDRGPRHIALSAGTFSPDGARVLLGDTNGEAHLWDVVSGTLLRMYEGHVAAVQAVAFTQNGDQAITAGGRNDHALRRWDTTALTPNGLFAGHAGQVNQVAFSPDGSRALTAGCDRTARLWNVSDGTEFHTFEDHNHSISDCVSFAAITADGTYGLTGTGKGLLVWNMETYEQLDSIGAHREAVHATAFSPDGALIVTGGQDRRASTCATNCASAKIWDRATGEIRQTYPHDAGVYAVAISPNGDLLLTGSQDGLVRLWSVPMGQLLRTYAGHTGTVQSVAFSPDGTRIVTAGADHVVLLWDWLSNTVLHTYVHPDDVQSVAFHPDGTRFVSTSGHGAYGWNAVDGGLDWVVGHTQPVKSARVSPDGRQLLTGGQDAAARFWVVPE